MQKYKRHLFSNKVTIQVHLFCCNATSQAGGKPVHPEDQVTCVLLCFRVNFFSNCGYGQIYGHFLFNVVNDLVTSSYSGYWCKSVLPLLIKQTYQEKYPDVSLPSYLFLYVLKKNKKTQHSANDMLKNKSSRSHLLLIRWHWMINQHYCQFF